MASEELKKSISFSHISISLSMLNGSYLAPFFLQGKIRDFAALIHSGRREGMSRRSSLKAREEAALVCANPPISKKFWELDMIMKERDV